MPKKVRVWYRALRKRWYGEHWQGGKRPAKAFASKADAYLWKSYMEHKLNYEPWQGTKAEIFIVARDLYFASKTSEGIAASSLAEIKRSDHHFLRILTVTGVQTGHTCKFGVVPTVLLVLRTVHTRIICRNDN